MKDDIKSHIQSLRQEVENIFGYSPKSPTDFNRLSADIIRRCGDSLAVSTIKRLWGYIDNPHKPTFTTLSLLARYAGYRNWDGYLNRTAISDIDSDFNHGHIAVTREEAIGTTFTIQWADNKSCTIRKIAEPTRFEIISSENIKLSAGDTADIDTLIKGECFVATNCVRNGKSLGVYVGARKKGISYFFKHIQK